MFDHGPGVPSAGGTEAWDLIWLGLLIVTLGHVVSAGWLAARLIGRARARGRWDRRLVWSTTYHLVAIPLALYTWFSS